MSDLFKNANGGFEYLPEQKHSGSLDALKVLAILLRHKVFILSSVLVTSIAALAYAFTLPNWYAATVSMVPPKRSVSGIDGMLGGVTSALKDIGLSKVGGKGGESYDYIVFLNSRRLRDTLIDLFDLPTLYDIPAEKKTKIRAALEDNLQINYEPEGNYTITAWHKNPEEAARMANLIVELANERAREIEQTESRVTREYLEMRLAQTDSIISTVSQQLQSFSKEKFLIAPEEQAQAAAAGLAELRAEIIKQEIMYEALKNNYGDADQATQQQKKNIAELRYQLSKAEKLPGFGGNFPLNEAASVGFNYQRLYVELETFSKLKAFLLPMIEQNRLDENRFARTMYILDPAIPSDQKDKPKRSLIVLGAALASFIFSVVFVIMRYRYVSFKQNYHYIFKEKAVTTKETV
ncbi:MAG TPA: Wzz/FepE/Etk N-terminal domain-containing protein [Patescibacteria group bacterium]|nr:Wzz/FepE/Etk N-terminal domain-containing protein [Patescibacteria group bacterium]